MAPHSRIPLSLLPLLVLGCSAGGPPAPAPEAAPAESAEVLPSEEAGYFTQAQSERGREVFQAVCGECHYTSEFRGRGFEWTWRRQTVRNLFDTVVETMPEDEPGSLSDRQYIDIIAYILQLNEYPSGGVELRPVDEAMDRVPLGPNARSGGDFR